MAKARNLKLRILAATALAGLAAAPSAALAEPAAAPTIEAHAAPVIVDDAPAQEAATKRWPLAAIGAAAVAGLLTLLDFKKLWRLTRKASVRAAKATGRAAVHAAQTASRAVGAPLRFLGLVAGLSIFALFGFAMFDLEWVAGLIAGVVATALFAAAALKMRAFFPIGREK